MATTIITGPVRSAKGVAKDQLHRVWVDWQKHAAIVFPEDCRGLLQIIEETESERVFERLGFKTPDDFYREKLYLDPDHVALARQWLTENPGKKIGLDELPALQMHGSNQHKARIKVII